MLPRTQSCTQTHTHRRTLRLQSLPPTVQACTRARTVPRVGAFTILLDPPPHLLPFPFAPAGPNTSIDLLAVTCLWRAALLIQGRTIPLAPVRTLPACSNGRRLVHELSAISSDSRALFPLFVRACVCVIVCERVTKGESFVS